MEEQVTVLELMAQASASTPAPRAVPPDEQLVDRVQRLTGELEGITDPGAQAIAEQLMGALLELYGEGLERILGLIGDDAARALADDGVVASLLLIHDLYPVPLEERVHEALASVRPYMESHGGDVELLSLDGGVASLRLSGSCDGCAASSATLELAIKKALEEAAPDLLGLEVEGVAEAPVHPPLPGTPLPLAPPAHGWIAIEGVSGLAEGAHAGMTAGGTDLVVANVNGTLLAYVDACGACSSSLAGGVLGDGVLICPQCSERFDLPRAGRGVDRSDIQLGPVPLLREGASEVRVALAR